MSKDALSQKDIDAIMEYLKEPEKFKTVYLLIEQQREEMINGLFDVLNWIIYSSPNCDALVQYAETKFEVIKELSGSGIDIIQELRDRVQVWELMQPNTS